MAYDEQRQLLTGVINRNWYSPYNDDDDCTVTTRTHTHSTGILCVRGGRERESMIASSLYDIVFLKRQHAASVLPTAH